MDDDVVEVEDLLVVDDNSGDRRLIEEAFQASALEATIHTTATSDEAVEFLAQYEEDEGPPTPLVVLLDWNLTQTTGAEVLEAATSGERSISIIVMTGSQPETRALGSTAEKADLIIEKPTDPSEYVEHVRSVLIER